LFLLSAEETPDIKFRNWFSGYAMFGAGLTTGEHLAVKITPPPFFSKNSDFTLSPRFVYRTFFFHTPF
jgi:hypothetical protein